MRTGVWDDASGEDEHRPEPHSWLDGRVLTCDGYDDSIRWRPGERLENLFEQRCDWLRGQGQADHLVVDAPDGSLSYAELDARANQLARFLIRHGVQPGDRIGLLSDVAVDGYVGMLAVLKAHAAFVPLDASFPADRVGYIASDAGVRLILTRSHLAAGLRPLVSRIELLCVEQAKDLIDAERHDPFTSDEVPPPPDTLAYVIYTSGSTGRPKGVAVGHASICNFVRVAAEVYGITRADRVYQGMTIAFDFSVEEIWVPWMCCATLVPKPDGGNLLGLDLGAFLRERHVTALCCVPTLLATLEEDLPELRFLLVSGESCPRDLIARWHRPGRRFLNVYGPTEATVTATWTVVHPGRPVTIGVPLPTYSVVILDPEKDVALAPGAMGEIGIAGIGLADGYLNRPDLTERAFRPDFLGIRGNAPGKIYRTGDLGRVNRQGEIEHHGRIDTQVKIRGYRIELTEIESVLLRVPGIAQAVVGTHRPNPDIVELVAYYSPQQNLPAVDPGRVYETLRERLPAYMVPAYLEKLAAIPMMPSGKADRKRLPPPSGQRLRAASSALVAPANGTESALAAVLADVLELDQVSVESHFFDELGASSLLMARYNAALRERTALPSVSMKDIYLHPTVRTLAASLESALPPQASGAAQPRPVMRSDPNQPLPQPTGQPSGTPHYFLCGVLQLLTVAACIAGGALGLDAGFTWALGAPGVLATYARLVAFGSGTLLGLGVLPIAVKWLLIGRWRPRGIRAWSLGYFRFWLVKTVVVANPMAHTFIGTPLYNLYLRALGARIGRGATILSQHVPVCTDLLIIGAGSLITKDTYVSCYRARAGLIETGYVTIGAGSFIGEHSVIDINAALGERAQLGHASALLSGQLVPPCEIWHGSPAEQAPDGTVYQVVPPARGGGLRRAGSCAARLLLMLAVAGPLEAAVASLLVTHSRALPALLGSPPVTTWPYYREALIGGAVVVFGLTLVGLIIVGPAGRSLSRLLKPGRVYPLYGFRHSVLRAVTRMSNIKFFNALLGDSSAIAGYLSYLGYRLKPVQQTGSNFGMEVKHDVPTLNAVGTGTLISDGLSFINAEFSASSFRVAPVVIGRNNFLGNGIAYPPRGRTGDNCLLATKVMIPVSGPVREGVGLLGSPCFEIPRSVSRDRQFGELSPGRVQRTRLRAKMRHNAATMSLYLLVRWLYVSGILVIALLPMRGDATLGGTLGTAGTVVADLLITIAYFVLVDRAVTGFRALRPKFCSIYQPAFWRHERFWKVPSIAYIPMFNGTPFKGVIWRLLGVRIGRRVFDDGCSIIERSLVSIGSNATLAAGSIIQCHSLEDGAFKSDRTVIGAGCSLGTVAFVHYGVTMGEGSALDADSFLMKGEDVPPVACWGGNPATERGQRALPQRSPQVSPAELGVAIHEQEPDTMDIFEARESAVRSYCRIWPTVFGRAAGSRLYDEHGRSYLDFFAGAGALNYGHNNPRLKDALLKYLADDGVIHSLDMHTVAKREFLTVLDELILRPRQLDYRVQFPGPGGANAVEAALKLARKVTGRTEIIAFTNSFHGMSLGALAVTGSAFHRAGAGIPLSHATPVPFAESLDPDGRIPDFQWLERLLGDRGSGLDAPAAAIVETVQGEGGINVASAEWLRRLSELCREYGILLIVDDVQMGCGRTGPFFSFEPSGITPDIVCVSKSISGYGLPLALTLIRPDLDIWAPGEHTGTFRGVNPALVTGTAALRAYWGDDGLERGTLAKGERIMAGLTATADSVPGTPILVRGRGMAWGLAFSGGDLAGKVSAAAFEAGLLAETAGSRGQVVKLLPPLTITDAELDEGLSVLDATVRAVC
jgi:diaminobutyrate--2-oxoglutarate aminotransferase